MRIAFWAIVTFCGVNAAVVHAYRHDMVALALVVVCTIYNGHRLIEAMKREEVK